MRSAMYRLIFGLMAIASLPLAAQIAEIQNGSVKYHLAQPDLARQMSNLSRQNGDTYFAYMVPAKAHHHSLDSPDGCQWNLKSGKYDRQNNGGFYTGNGRGPESNSMLLVVKYDAGELDRLNMVSEVCQINAGGTILHWLNEVDPAASIEFLANWLESRPKQDEGFAALAMHRHPAATTKLIEFTYPEFARDLRKSAVFWLGQREDDASLNRLVQLTSDLQDEALREHLSFVLSIRKDRAAQDALLKMAQQDPSDRIREKALFWMAQSGHPDAEAMLLDRLEAEPELAADHQIGFMLSQLPDGKGQAHLTRLALSHAAPEVRQDALFWLCQSQAENALETALGAAESDPSEDVRKKAIFSIAQISEDRSVPALLKFAKDSDDPDVRGTAIFWLGQKASEKVKDLLIDTVENDPDTQVQQQALLGINNLPMDRKIPMFIDIAKNHPNAQIRQQAVFWLGQTGDERAVAFIKELLLESK